jgi:hypothetical protein
MSVLFRRLFSSWLNRLPFVCRLPAALLTRQTTAIHAMAAMPLAAAMKQLPAIFRHDALVLMWAEWSWIVKFVSVHMVHVIEI